MLDDFLQQQPAVNPTLNQQLRWEERVVKTLLKHYNLTAYSRDLLHSAAQLTGISGFNIAVWYQYWPDFPVYLLCRKVPDVYKLTLAHLLDAKQLVKSSLYKHYQLYASDAPTEDYALVFELLHSSPTMKIMHTGPGSGTALTFTTKHYPKLTIQNFTTFLSNLSWTPSNL